MTLLEQFNSDIIATMKRQDKERLTVLRMIKGAMQLEHINNKKELTDEMLIDIVLKQIKMRTDSIIEFEKGNRTDLVDKTKSEIKILEEYLPEQLSLEEIKTIINEAISVIKPNGPKDMGLVMREVTPKLKGQADMKVVSNLIKDILSN